jgi:hypothetical protein
LHIFNEDLEQEESDYSFHSDFSSAEEITEIIQQPAHILLLSPHKIVFYKFNNPSQNSSTEKILKRGECLSKSVQIN